MKRKSLLRMAGEVIWYMVVFLLIQVIVQGTASVVEAYLAEGDLKSSFANGLANADNIGITALIISNVVSSLLTIIIFLKAKWTLWARDYLATRPWGVVFWVIILSFGLIIPTMWLQEELHLEMPKEMEELFTSVCSTPYGYFALAVLAPWAEEVVFRGAILRKLLEIFSHQMHWVAIVISAIIFGAVHMNMAQGVNAFVLGLLLGWMFYRTGSIFPGIVLHWANASLTDICGGDENKVLLYVGFSMLIVIPAIFQLFIRMKKPQKRN